MSTHRTRRRGRIVLGWMAVLAVLAGAALARGTWEVRHTTLAENRFATGELTGELRIVQITDFHNLPRPAQVRDIVELVRLADPDVIAITGDLVNTANHTLDPARRLLEGLSGISAPVFFVDGNHDHWSSDHDDVHDLLRRHGALILDNEHTLLEGDFGAVTLVGVDDTFTANGDLAAAVEGADDDTLRVVVTHSPGILPELGAHGVDYAMCGHTHGGQIRLPLIGALYQPGGDWFPLISKGVYTDGDATLFVDSGVGVTGPPLRLFNQSQVTLHRLGPAR